MRPVITFDASGHLSSTIIAASAASNVEVGMRFEFDRPYETPWGEVPEGTKATVTEVHNVTGELDLEVAEPLPALFLWKGVLTILPFMSEDLTACLHLLC